MVKFLAKRAAQAIIVVLMITCVTFLLMNLIPGGPFLSEKSVPQQTIAAMDAKYGLDESVPVQMKNYILQILSGDFGVSLKMQRNRPVLSIIFEMFPVSALIGGIALLLAVGIGTPFGCLAAYRKGRPFDRIMSALTALGISIPGFVAAALFLILFGSVFRLFPTMGLSGWQSYVLPCAALALYPLCYIARLTRASMLDVLNREYIRALRAKGLSPFSILFGHALRNAFLPVLTYLGPLTASILTGTFAVETVFNIPGLGRYYIQSIWNRDYPLIMGTTIFFAALLLLMNLLVDLCYKALDPRIDLVKGRWR